MVRLAARGREGDRLVSSVAAHGTGTSSGAAPSGGAVRRPAFRGGSMMRVQGRRPPATPVAGIRNSKTPGQHPTCNVSPVHRRDPDAIRRPMLCLAAPADPRRDCAAGSGDCLPPARRSFAAAIGAAKIAACPEPQVARHDPRLRDPHLIVAGAGGKAGAGHARRANAAGYRHVALSGHDRPVTGPRPFPIHLVVAESGGGRSASGPSATTALPSRRSRSGEHPREIQFHSRDRSLRSPWPASANRRS